MYEFFYVSLIPNAGNTVPLKFVNISKREFDDNDSLQLLVQSLKSRKEGKIPAPYKLTFAKTTRRFTYESKLLL